MDDKKKTHLIKIKPVCKLGKNLFWSQLILKCEFWNIVEMHLLSYHKISKQQITNKQKSKENNSF